MSKLADKPVTCNTRTGRQLVFSRQKYRCLQADAVRANEEDAVEAEQGRGKEERVSECKKDQKEGMSMKMCVTEEA